MKVGITKSSIFEFAGVPCAYLTAGLQENYVVSKLIRIIKLDSESFDETFVSSIKEKHNEISYDYPNENFKSEIEYCKTPSFLPSFIYQNSLGFVLPERYSTDSNPAGYHSKVRPLYQGQIDSGCMTCILSENVHEIEVYDITKKLACGQRLVLREIKNGKWCIVLQKRKEVIFHSGPASWEDEKIYTKFTDPNFTVRGRRFRSSMSKQGWRYIPEKKFWANASANRIKVIRKESRELSRELIVINEQIKDLERAKRRINMAFPDSITKK